MQYYIYYRTLPGPTVLHEVVTHLSFMSFLWEIDKQSRPRSGPEVIKLFFMLNSAEQEI